MKPAARLLIAVAVCAALALILFWQPQLRLWWTAGVGLLLLVAVFDMFAVARHTRLHGTRTLPNSLALGIERPVRLEIANRGSRGLRIDVFDHHPSSFACRSLPWRGVVEANAFVDCAYPATPLERGRHDFGVIDVRVHSPLGLWTQRTPIAAKQTINVFPNFASVSKYTVLGVDSQASTGGFHLRPRRGEGSEFHQLREYRVGDTFRQIDWKATARIGKLITKEYQEERDQQIVFLIDTGRRMLAREDNLSHFDHVLNAMLLLSYVALRQGDAVGFMTCAEEPLWMKPEKGLSAINTMASRLFDLQPKPVAVDYQAAATQLAQRQKRRALVVLLTNIRDEDSDDLKMALRLLRKRHLLLVASLRETAIDDLLDDDIGDFGDALKFAAAHNYLDSRRATHDALGGKGVIIEDTSCALLPQAIARRYAEIKRAGML